MDSSRLKYALPPAGMPPSVKFTVPSFAFATVKDVFGPSYPVSPNGHPSGFGVTAHSPSPSKPKMEGPLSARPVTGPEELFCTPISVSSISS